MPRSLRLSRMGFAFFALLAILLTSQFGLAALAQLLWPAVTTHPLYIWVLSFFPLYGIALPVCLLILPRAGVPSPLPPKKMSVGGWLLALVMAVGFMSMGNLVGTLLTELIAALRGKAAVDSITDLVLSSNLWITALCTVILAPLGEEFIFRRLIIDRARAWGERTAILLSALLFGAFHLNLHQFFYAFLIGLVLGYVYLRTGKLRWAVSLHAAINFLGSVLVPLLYREMLPLIDALSTGDLAAITAVIFPSTAAVVGVMLYFLFLMGSLVASIVLSIVGYRRLRFAPIPEQPRAALLDVGVLCFLLLSAVMMVISV